jgi:peroxiredoxin
MRNGQIAGVIFAFLIVPAGAQETIIGGPTSEQADRTYRQGIEYVNRRMFGAALQAFKKADQQDGGHCLACKKRVLQYGEQARDWKSAEQAAEELVGEARQPKDVALAHYERGRLLMAEAIDRRKDDLFHRAHEEFNLALTISPQFSAAVFADGRALAHLKLDDESKKRFQQFGEMSPRESPERQRALLYNRQPELARVPMAPAFAVTTLDGKQISVDDLQGKVVLIDFWAVWCEPCLRALPQYRDLVRRFDGQPLLILGVSVDTDEARWKEYVLNNDMPWPQYFDNGFGGPLARSFGVQSIPHTFTIDADGILRDEQIDGASIEGKLKKLVRRAQEKKAAAAKPSQ